MKQTIFFFCQHKRQSSFTPLSLMASGNHGTAMSKWNTSLHTSPLKSPDRRDTRWHPWEKYSAVVYTNRYQSKSKAKSLLILLVTQRHAWWDTNRLHSFRIFSTVSYQVLRKPLNKIWYANESAIFYFSSMSEKLILFQETSIGSKTLFLWQKNFPYNSTTFMLKIPSSNIQGVYFTLHKRSRLCRKK